MKCHSLFSEKKKKKKYIINLFFAKLAQRLIKVKMVVFSAEKKLGKKMIIDEVNISRLVIFNFSFPFSF